MNHKDCNDSGTCPLFKQEGVQEGVCYPTMTEEMLDWHRRLLRGEPVGRAPATCCPFYNE